MKHYILILTIPFLPGMTLAESSSYPFDKAFTTQEQRQILDRLRKEKQYGEGQQIESKQTSDKPKSNSFTISGIVIREDGRHMVWVNGKSELTQENSQSDLVVGNPTKYSKQVPLSSSEKSKSLKPGQTWIVNSNQVKEGYEFKTAKKAPAIVVGDKKDASQTDMLKTIKALKEINAQ